MPNPTPAKYTVQLGPTVTPQTAGELATWADMLGVSTSEVTRECIAAGLELLTPDLIVRAMLRDEVDADTPPKVRTMFAEKLAAHIVKAQERGKTQVGRRREYDRATRSATPVAEVAKPVKRARTRRAAA